jgi:hypothetical protein
MIIAHGKVGFRCIGLDGVIITSMTVDGPAYNCGLLDLGDLILSVDGVAVHDQNINEALTGSDIPGFPGSKLEFGHFGLYLITDVVPRGSDVNHGGKAPFQKPPNQNNGRGSSRQAGAGLERASTNKNPIRPDPEQQEP